MNRALSKAPTLGTEAEVRRLLVERPERTQTYRVTPELLRTIELDSKDRLRRLGESELAELAEYLEVDQGQLAGDFRVVDASCAHCGRRTSFLDFVQTGVGTRHHDRRELAEVLTGRRGAWLTIRGRDGGRPVICANCGQIARLTDGYSEYSSSSYAYA